MRQNNLGTMKKCCVCGKRFYVPAWQQDGYCYRPTTHTWCCSYSCYRKSEKECGKVTEN